MPKAAQKSDKKQARDLDNHMLYVLKEQYGGLSASERRQIEKHFKINLNEVFGPFWSNEQRRAKAHELRKRLIERKKHLIPSALINTIK